MKRLGYMLVLLVSSVGVLSFNELARRQGPVALYPMDTSPTAPCPVGESCCPCGPWCDCVVWWGPEDKRPRHCESKLCRRAQGSTMACHKAGKCPGRSMERTARS